jgi:hypothetical protein
MILAPPLLDGGTKETRAAEPPAKAESFVGEPGAMHPDALKRPLGAVRVVKPFPEKFTSTVQVIPLGTSALITSEET